MNSSDISTITKKMDSMSMTQRVVRHNKRLPQSRYSPYTKESTNFTNEKQKEEAMRLGVELSLFVAEAMFLLSDNIRSMLLFCLFIFKYAGYKNIKDGPMGGRMFCVMLYVFETYIKPKNGVYQNDGRSTQYELMIKASTQHYALGIRIFDHIVLILTKGDLVHPSDFEKYKQVLKMLEEKLRSSKGVSEANGFAREAIKSNILHLWKSLFETPPNKLILPKERVLEMFRPPVNQSREDICSRLIASLHI